MGRATEPCGPTVVCFIFLSSTNGPKRPQMGAIFASSIKWQYQLKVDTLVRPLPVLPNSKSWHDCDLASSCPRTFRECPLADEQISMDSRCSRLMDQSVESVVASDGICHCVIASSESGRIRYRCPKFLSGQIRRGLKRVGGLCYGRAANMRARQDPQSRSLAAH
jgi:hypothetical protein